MNLLIGFLLSICFSRLWKTLHTLVLGTVWPHIFWASVTDIMIISWSRGLATCSTLTLARSWAMPKCLAILKGTLKSLQTHFNVSHPLQPQAFIFTLDYALCMYIHALRLFCFHFHYVRDRAPFVLTRDMAYVINDGDKPTVQFQKFCDLCCTAYNELRKHTTLFVSLLSLVSFTLL